MTMQADPVIDECQPCRSADAGEDAQPGFDFPPAVRLHGLVDDLEQSLSLTGDLFGPALATAIDAGRLDALRFAIDQAALFAEQEWDRAEAARRETDGARQVTREFSDRCRSLESSLRAARARWFGRSPAQQDLDVELDDIAEAHLVEHDDAQTDGELALAAAALALTPDVRRAVGVGKRHRPTWWPWAARTWDGSNRPDPQRRRAELLVAAGFLVREAERLRRAECRAEVAESARQAEVDG